MNILCDRCLSIHGIKRSAQYTIPSVLFPDSKVYLCADHVQMMIEDKHITWDKVKEI